MTTKLVAALPKLPLSRYREAEGFAICRSRATGIAVELMSAPLLRPTSVLRNPAIVQRQLATRHQSAGLMQGEPHRTEHSLGHLLRIMLPAQ